MRWLFDVCTVPRPPGIASALETLQLVSRVLQQATQAGGMPPNGLACDGGSNNSKLLGIFGAARSSSAEYFALLSRLQGGRQSPGAALLATSVPPLRVRHPCVLQRLNHWQKRYSLAHLSRKIRHGGIYVDLSAVDLTNGLPEAAYIVSDAQSDVASCQRLSPPFCTKTWASLGVVVHGVLAALICSATTGSVGFSMEDICQNAMSALYLLLLHRSESSRQCPDRAERNRNSLSDITLKNGVALAHFAVVFPPVPTRLGLNTILGVSKRHIVDIRISRITYMGIDLCVAGRSDSCKAFHSDKAIQDCASSFDRSPPSLETVKKLSRQALSSAIERSSIPGIHLTEYRGQLVSSMQTCESGGSMKDRTCFAAPRLQPA